jgi:hypothetical protein
VKTKLIFTINIPTWVPNLQKVNLKPIDHCHDKVPQPLKCLKKLRTYLTWDRIHNNSSHNKLKCYITLGWKGLPGMNTPA